MSVNTQIDRVEGPQGPRGIAANNVRAKLHELANLSGIRPGPPRERYVRLLMHKAGLTNGRGHRFQYDAPPKSLTGDDCNAIDRAVNRDLDALATYLLPPAPAGATPPPLPRPRPEPDMRHRGGSFENA